MKPYHKNLEHCKLSGPPNEWTGWYMIHRGNARLKVLVSDGGGWDHVSVSLATRCPTWDEMCWVKSLFFHDEETAMQLHPAKSDYVNYHEFCLHLWRPQSAEEIAEIRLRWELDGELWPDEYGMESPGVIPKPPSIFVGPMVGKEAH